MAPMGNPVPKMMFATGQNRNSHAQAVGLTSPGRWPCRPGFTLIEIMLALAVVLMLTGLAVFNFVPWGNSKKFQEGSFQFESLLRLMRAESANIGKKLRLEFDDQTREVTVTCEDKPLEQPGQFVAYYGGAWANNLPNGLVCVSRCDLTSSGIWVPANSSQGGGPSQKALSPITFYPDGSSDSAVIELVGREAGESRTAVIVVDGVNGTVIANMLGESELADYHDHEQASGS
jgi:prepilin-type N-terminal cleavage/methylation domain-containing protein